MSMKIFLIKIMVFLLNFIYKPMKLLPTKKKIVYLSRQGNEKSLDIEDLHFTTKKLNYITHIGLYINKFRMSVFSNVNGKFTKYTTGTR